MRWWKIGLLGSAALSLFPAMRLAWALVAGGMGRAEWRQAPAFFAAIFGIGFLCGVVAWALKGLSRRFGMAGDALVGAAVMATLCLSCMFLPVPDMLASQFVSEPALMLTVMVVAGMIGGVWIGRDLRKEFSKQLLQHRTGRAVITPQFVDRIIRAGPLSKARGRVQNRTARPRNEARWETFSSWTLICEEILDTEPSDDWYDGIVVELNRRGFSFEQIDAMRRLAWQTAG